MHYHLPGRRRRLLSRSHQLLAAIVLVAACRVVDQAGPVSDISELVIIPDTVSVSAGATVQFQALGRTPSGQTHPVHVSWSASGGTIDATGLFTADSTPGDFQVTATLDQPHLTSSARVKNRGPLKHVVLSPATSAVTTGAQIQFSASGTVANGDTVAVSITYTATGGSISGTGMYTAGQTVGTYRVIASANGGALADTSAVTVAATSPPVASVTVTPATASLAVGLTQQLQITLKDATGAVLTGPVSWSSSNTAVATVSSSGLVSGKVAGAVTITATSGGVSGTAAITVTAVPVASLTVSPASASVQVEGTVQLTATPKDASGNVLTGTITWSSSNAAVAAVNASGVVTGLLAGSATITATCEGKGGTAAITVTGSAPPPPTGGCSGAWPAAVFPRMPLSTGQAFYVSASSGNDANPGTLSAPWKTLQKAFDALQPGQIAYLRAGTYGAFCTSSRFSRAGTVTAPITVQGYAGERAVIHGNIRLEGSYFRLANVVVEGPSCGTWGATTQQGENLIVMFPGVTHHVEVSNSEVYHSGWHAGIGAGGDDIWILNNYIHDNGGFNDTTQYNTSHGIYYSDGTRGVVANNILEHNRAKGLSARYSANHILVVNNTAVGNGRSGMDIAENTHDWLFANNVLVNNGNVNNGMGINTSGSSGGLTNVLINNVFWNNGTSGSNTWSSNASATNNLVANPLLVNPANSVPSTTHAGYSNDYHLGAGSPAINFATVTYALPFDIGGVCRPRGAGPDAGVYEM